MEKRHISQLPWTCEHQGSDTDFCIVGPRQNDNSSELIAIVIHKLGEIERLGNIKNANSSNGNFIVRACNYHHELVDALRAASVVIRNVAGCHLSADDIDALIAKAEGQ